ncbi:MAG TPA: prephenate dehydrogenase [Catalimonadaceae bacterium]|nr:prephenate dehydrogenase [Catalimonadaceae bacterium]
MNKTICFIGLGLIGGSMALKIKKEAPSVKRIGVETNEDHARFAIQEGIVDEVLSLEEAISNADLVVIALPVNLISGILPTVLNLVSGTQKTVLDAGSTKKGICDSVTDHPARTNFVAGHPIAGTENSGPAAAFDSLFDNKRFIICESEKSSAFALDEALRFVSLLNMQVTFLTPDVHDRSYAYVSHLSHAISYSLGVSVLEMEKEIEGLVELSGSGFSSMVRLAKSSASMWVPVLMQNQKETTMAIDRFVSRLERVKDLINQKDEAGLRAFILHANEIHELLLQKERNAKGSNPA